MIFGLTPFEAFVLFLLTGSPFGFTNAILKMYVVDWCAAEFGCLDPMLYKKIQDGGTLLFLALPFLLVAIADGTSATGYFFASATSVFTAFYMLYFAQSDDSKPKGGDRRRVYDREAAERSRFYLSGVGGL